jgi:hypothetical protein
MNFGIAQLNRMARNNCVVFSITASGVRRIL